MSQNNKAKIIEFVTPYYAEKDIMHNFSHIKRVINKAKDISSTYSVDFESIEYGAYFHGMIKEEEAKISKLLHELNFDGIAITQIINIVKASHKDLAPVTTEEKILHDAHILEGGNYFQIVKSLVTGTARNQTLEETINYFNNNIIGKFECYLPESKEELKLKEKYSREVSEDVAQSIFLEISED